MKNSFDGESVYKTRYRSYPNVGSQAPGRVEILGNHTDYNGGYVLSAALDKTVSMHGEARDEPFVTLYSISMDEETRFPLNSIAQDPTHSWADYVKGVILQLQKHEVEVGGFRAVIGGDLPVVSGLGYAAALESAVALFISSIYPYPMERSELAQLCRAVEKDFVGITWGPVDQYTTLFGQKAAFLCLDCYNLSHKSLPVPEPHPRIVLCDSGIRYEQNDHEYRNRRCQCEGAARALGEHLGKQINVLRDVTILEFMDLEDTLDDVQRIRARHVLYENQRVQRGIAALQLNDIRHLGELMSQSHESSRDFLENSCPELDFLVEEACSIPGCFGAKLTGIGFGGWTVNLVESSQSESFIEEISRRFTEQFGQPCKTLNCSIGDGATIL